MNHMRLIERVRKKLHLFAQGRLRCFPIAVSLVKGKRGLEIGGPTDIFEGWRKFSRVYGLAKPLPIYDLIGSLDNCNFASVTIWSRHTDGYCFSPVRPSGRTIIADGSALSSICDGSYDFVLSSHNLEHFANPIKALNEWKRITRPGGALILNLPYYKSTFDHRRVPTSVQHIIKDYRECIGEDDMTHLSEVFESHDLDRDGTLKTHTLEELRVRSLANFENRCLHHHVFDENNSVELLRFVGLEILAVEKAVPYHLVVLAKWTNEAATYPTDP